jgi:hypothetical protein
MNVSKPRLPVDVKAGDLCDKNGVPIHPGDLLRTRHFRARLRRQQMYLYHMVVWKNDFSHGGACPRLVLECVPVSELYKSGDGGKCWLHGLANDAGVLVKSEVIHSHGDPWWPERKRRKLA